MSRYDRDEIDIPTPADLEKDAAVAAASAASTSANSYTKTIRMVPVKDKTYKFFFTYLHEDSETKLITESERSPAFLVKHVIENGTLPVQDLTLTPGFKCYGVKFTINPLSTQDDVVIFESLTSDFAVQNIVYVGTSTNVTIQASSYAPRWVKVRSRDRWDDFNISEVTAGPVTPLNSEIDTTKVPKAPTGVGVTPSIDPEDKSGFSIKIDVSWTASTDADTNGYVIRWSANNPATVTNPLWEYGQVDGKEATKFSITGLTPNTVYYWQVTAKSPFNSISWNTGIAGQVASGSFGPVSDPNAPAGNLQLRSILSIGGKTADLFKIGTGITQSINTSNTITPTQTAGTYNGIILDRSTTNFGHNYWLNTGQFRVGSESSFLYWDGSDVYTTGKINATGGTFTGNLRVTTGSIIAGGTFAADGTVSGARVVMQSGGLYAHDAAGAQSVFIQASDGLIDARKGFVGGWTINATSQTDGYIQSSNTKIESNGTITLGDTTGSLGSVVKLSATDNFRLWVGSQNSQNARFKVSKEGVLYAEGAVIGLGAGSTIDGYATTTALGNYTLSSVTTGINSRLQTVEGAYVSAITLSTGLSTKNTTFVSESAPTANRIGDIWIDTSSDAGNEIKTWNGSSWTSRRDTTFAKTTDLSTKLNATSYVVQSSVDNSISMNTNGITVFSGATSNNGFNSGITFNSAGIAAWKNGNPTFSILTDGTATFAGTLSAATGSFSGAVNATSGVIGGFTLTGGTDFTGNLASNPRIIFGSKVLIGSIDLGGTSGDYGLRIGNPYGTAGQSFRINTADNVNRFTADSASTTYAGEVRNALRAAPIRSIGAVITESSSRRFKENIVAAPKRYYDRILNVDPMFYTYKTDSEEVLPELRGHHRFGMIAEDLEDAGLGYFVERDMQGRPTNLNDMMSFPLLLIPIIKELKQEVQSLKNSIVAMGGTI